MGVHAGQNRAALSLNTHVDTEKNHENAQSKCPITQTTFETSTFWTSIYLYIPVAPTWSIGHPWNAWSYFSFLILDNWQGSLEGGSARRKAATYTE
jgi:hypothetical protein